MILGVSFWNAQIIYDALKDDENMDNLEYLYKSLLTWSNLGKVLTLNKHFYPNAMKQSDNAQSVVSGKTMTTNVTSSSGSTEGQEGENKAARLEKIQRQIQWRKHKRKVPKLLKLSACNFYYLLIELAKNAKIIQPHEAEILLKRMVDRMDKIGKNRVLYELNKDCYIKTFRLREIKHQLPHIIGDQMTEVLEEGEQNQKVLESLNLGTQRRRGGRSDR